MEFLDVEHRLRFHYDDFIHESWMELRVQPASSPHQTVHSFYLAVGPPTAVSRYLDWNQNRVHHFGIADYHDRIEVVSRSLVEVHPTHPGLEELRAPPEPASGALLDFARFDGPVTRSAGLEALLAELALPEGAPLGEVVDGLGRGVLDHFEYQPGITGVRSSVDHVLESRKGVCQDFAHLTLGLLRLRGIPCRYVSGYLHVERSDREASQSHAWIEVHAPDHGWVPYDPTHARVPDHRYVTVGRGRDYDDTPPNRGVYRGSGGESLHAEVHTRLSEQRGVVGLHEQLEEIDVPVYRELPVLDASADRVRDQEQQDPRQQQQQQQQQSGAQPVERRGA